MIIPNIVNTYIGLFKDTTSVFIVDLRSAAPSKLSSSRSEMGDAGDLDDRICGRRHLLSDLLLRHVALRSRDAKPASPKSERR